MSGTQRPGSAFAPARASAHALAVIVLSAVLAACTTAPATAPSPSPTSTAAEPTAEPTATGPQVPVRDATLGAQEPAPAAPAPVRLAVPDVGIDMAVDPVGVRDDGEMEIPEDANRAGWYRFGPAPADPAGATVVAAHVDSVQTGIGQFARLLDVAVGATVTVTTADGVAHEYRVVTVEKVPKDGAPVDQWFDRSGAPRLVLVTCGGTFRRDIGHYTDNVVVTAEPIGG
ncbi:class F sortase [Cellulomonas fengjieae]|uniref:Class F sortase n=1 Tax=Cellulomonas fengjieae TaxID=2819978 RepID=A0ABS3SK79_9CELL|nr:class F sortase [Cellulomonas fengjieae]MBO3086148.1 class F sortase [Cellulomonas fengjieae]QVI65791.1 class F sortase [Cellulomonas fengjieae]